jgi:hypothetical protein
MGFQRYRIAVRDRGAIAILLTALLGVPPQSARAIDTGAVGNGDWSSAATWTNGVPGANDNAYIGGLYPTGAVSTAAVTLSQNSSAANVYLGNGAGTTGTLDLNGFNLSANNLYLGQNSGSGGIARTGGGTLSISVPYVSSSPSYGSLFENTGGSFSFDPSDVVQGLSLSNGASANTTATGNVVIAAVVGSGSMLSLGANLSLHGLSADPGPLGGVLDLRGVLNANGNSISAQTVDLGFYGGPFTLTNRGPIVTNRLYVSSTFTAGLTNFNLSPADAVSVLDLSGVNITFPAGAAVNYLSLHANGATPPAYSTAVTLASGNITNSVSVDPGNTLLLGTGLTLTGTLDLRGTLNANGHTISAASISLGSYSSPFALVNRGPITAGGLDVWSVSSQGPMTFNLTTADQVQSFGVHGVNTVIPAGFSVQNLGLSGS